MGVWGGRGLSTHRRARPPAGSHVSRLGREALEDGGKGGCTGASHVRLPEPSSFLGEFCWQGLGAKTKAALSPAFQMETLTLALHTGLPWHTPQKPAWWPPGWRDPETEGGEGSRVQVTSRSKLLPLGPTPVTVLNTGLLSPLVHESPTKRHAAFSPWSELATGAGGPRHWEEDNSGDSLVGLGVRSLGSSVGSAPAWLGDLGHVI